MSVSGLNEKQRSDARQRALQAALLSLHHAPEVHYTQGPQRWEGIAKKLNAAKGQYPTEADCSSSVTWWVGWNGLHLPFNMPDILNGDRWLGGYTGTLGEHGREVIHLKNILHADIQLYGTSAPWEHVAMFAGHHKGKPMVISHGSEAGPFLLPFDYRSDTGEMRRFI